MDSQAAGTDQAPTTAERILDAAEALFAEKGYSATSLGDMADRVGIRSPSLYNHFKNKEALYEAVLERLLTEFSAPLEELGKAPVTYERVFQWLETIVRQHHANPNLARLLQHAALSGGPHTNEMIDRLFRPMFQPDAQIEGGATGFVGVSVIAVIAVPQDSKRDSHAFRAGLLKIGPSREKKGGNRTQEKAPHLEDLTGAAHHLARIRGEKTTDERCHPALHPFKDGLGRRLQERRKNLR